MKTMLVLLLTAFSFNSFAGNGVERLAYPVDFSRAQGLPTSIQNRIEKVLATRCQPAADSASRVSVKNLEITKDKIDQGQVDYYYKFDVILHGWEAYEKEVISMEIAEYAIQNIDDNISVLNLSTSAEGLCK
ncbi:hypothetical protein [Bdellovibrio bacteriovorus]|uniref:hypothetical protein n=1 Tax=Bdellovibrio TaxID=958 RepID=UPI0035A929DD